LARWVREPVVDPFTGADVTDPTYESARRPVVYVAVGTGVVGVSGLAILLLTAGVLGAEDYATFGLFWSALYFVVAALSGVQQETTRAASVPEADGGRTSLLVFGTWVAVGIAAVTIATSAWWSPPTLGSGRGQLAAAVALGSAAYVLVAVSAAVLAAAGRWGVYCAMNVTEGVVRAVAVAAVLLVTRSAEALAWAVVGAYVAVLLVVVLPALRSGNVPVRVRESLGRLTGNSAQTLLAAVAVAALVNGFPLLMATFSGGASIETLGAMTLAVMLTRAPLLVPLVGAQSLLITMFADPDRSVWRLVLRLLIGVLAIAALLAGLAGLLGPTVLHHTIGPNFALSGTVLALLVLSSGALGALSMTSPALLAANRHADHVTGWIVAAVGAVAILALSPWDLETRAPVSLIVGPLAGLVWHLAAIARHGRVTSGRTGAADEDR
jgi:O-antigen/teichoic acid export membrane protein